MIPEFVGRFPNWVALQELSESDMINILTGVKNSYVDQYKWLFEQDGVELNFTSEALTTVAQRTLKTRTGARGLHSELERVLLPHMFRLKRYARSGIKYVEIDQDLVNTPQALKEAA
jgi:ATP-dependent Clp protease ATP-binding subunit ClpX